MTRLNSMMNNEDGTSLVGQNLGGAKLVRELDRHTLARRYLGHDQRRGVDRLVYVFDRGTGDSRESIWEALRLTVGAQRPHVLSIEQAGRERGGMIWASSPYPGNQESIVTLADLRKRRGGRLSAVETERAIEQLLEAASASHKAGIEHGPHAEDEILVNPSGSLQIELYGLGRRAGLVRTDEEPIQEEIRSIAALAWTLLTGIDAAEREVFASRVGRWMSPRWKHWIDRGLDPILSFGSAREAFDALPGRAGPAGVEVTATRSLLGRLSSAIGGGKDNAAVWSRKKHGPDGVE